jgi:hypothetical protein
MKESLENFEKHCDITLIDQNGDHYPIQSQSLKSRSRYFERLLSEQWNQTSDKQTFKIQTNSAWTNIRTWILTGKVCFDREELFDVLEFADMYAFDSLIEYSSKKLLKFGEKDKKSTLSSHINNIEIFLHPRFFDILLAHQHSILLNHFSLSPIYTLLAAVTFRIAINSQFTVFEYSNWWTRSLTTDLTMISEKLHFDPKVSESFNLYLIKGVSLKFEHLSLSIYTNIYDKTSLSADVFGVDAEGKLFPQSFDNWNTEYFSHFLVKPICDKDKSFSFIGIDLEGEVRINY